MAPGAVFALFFSVFVAVVVLVFWYRWYAKKERRQGLASMAASLGLTYEPEDPYALDSYPFELFGRGEGQGAENVLEGTWSGIDLKEFDFWYYTESSNGKGGTSRTYHYFSCAMAELPIDASPTTIAPETVLTRIADHLGFEDIQFESDQFNREYRVKGHDAKFCTDLVDARMMGWLLGTRGWSFELSGPYLLCYCGRLKPAALIPLLGTLQQFRDHIPRVVYDLYGTARPAKGSEAQ